MRSARLLTAAIRPWRASSGWGAAVPLSPRGGAVAGPSALAPGCAAHHVVLVALCLAAFGNPARGGEECMVYPGCSRRSTPLRAVPGPAGFAAVHAAGAVRLCLRADVGFLLGALSLWCRRSSARGWGQAPFQMFVTGWVGYVRLMPRLELAAPRVPARRVGAGVAPVRALLNLCPGRTVSGAAAEMYWQPVGLVSRCERGVLRGDVAGGTWARRRRRADVAAGRAAAAAAARFGRRFSSWSSAKSGVGRGDRYGGGAATPRRPR